MPQPIKLMQIPNEMYLDYQDKIRIYILEITIQRYLTV